MIDEKLNVVLYHMRKGLEHLGGPDSPLAVLDSWSWATEPEQVAIAKRLVKNIAQIVNNLRTGKTWDGKECVVLPPDRYETAIGIRKEEILRRAADVRKAQDAAKRIATPKEIVISVPPRPATMEREGTPGVECVMEVITTDDMVERIARKLADMGAQIDLAHDGSMDASAYSGVGAWPKLGEVEREEFRVEARHVLFGR